MIPPLAPEIPLVVVANIAEAFYGFLRRAANAQEVERLVHIRQQKGDRALLWLGNRPKMVFTSLPVPHACIQNQIGEGECLFPATPSPWLSLDILRETTLIRRLVAYAGEARTVQIIPYATTSQFMRLAEALRRDFSIEVLLPESPSPQSRWLRDYIDSKSGFRALASRWLRGAEELLPEGFICRGPKQAAEVASWFQEQGRACVVKCDDGEGGIGQVWPAAKGETQTDLYHSLRKNPFFQEGLLLVEEVIDSPRRLFPSLEVFVPPTEQGQPQITYVCNQVFLPSGRFAGVLLDRSLEQSPWYPHLAEAGLTLAQRLQTWGYVGHFDLDAVVTQDDRLYLLEVNARRTGGTHVHEFAQAHFGPRYLERISLLSHDEMPCGAIRRLDDLQQVLSDLHFPMRGQDKGVIVSISSTLTEGRFGGIIVADSGAEALSIQQVLLERLQAGGADIVQRQRPPETLPQHP